MKHTLNIDIEDYSPVDIKYGVYKRAESGEIILLAYSLDFAPVVVLDLTKQKIPAWLLSALTDDNYIKRAFNAPYERNYFNITLGIYSPPEQWECTQARAAMCGLPLSLDEASKALGLIEKKDPIGKSLIRYFCVPCKATIANGGRTRNLPEHDPEKWAQFCGYNAQDVVVEQNVDKACRWYSIPDIEHQTWCLNERKNERGVMIDLKLVDSAIIINKAYREELIEEATDISGLSNVNSPKQLKEWLSDEMDEEVTTLNKLAVRQMLIDEEDPDVKRILQIRQLMSKSSITKYLALKFGACNDLRVRGMIQYYGANRTGREAGRGPQPQNFPRLEDMFQEDNSFLDDVRELVKNRDVESLHFVFPNLSNILSQMLRPTFVAAPGKEFVVLDFSSIESLACACLAGEQWRIDFFKTGGDIYKASGAVMFHIPVERITKDIRQKCKIAELLCIEENQLVLTNHGLIPIKNVSLCDKVWDGFHFVTHGGVIFKGYKNVIEYDGLKATEDHLVWVKGKQEPVQFGEAKRNSTSLLRSGIGGASLRLVEDYRSGKMLETKLASSYGSCAVYKLRNRNLDKFIFFKKRYNERMQILLPACFNSKMAENEVKRSLSAMHEPKRQRVQKLWTKRRSVQICLDNGSRLVDSSEYRITRQSFRVGQDRQRKTLRTWQSQIHNTSTKQSQQTNYQNAGLETGRMAFRLYSSSTKIKSGLNQRTNDRRSKINSFEPGKSLQQCPEKVAVYDILNAGPYNRFTVSNVLVHNCQYGGGEGAMERNNSTIEDPKKRIPEKEIAGLIKTWRKANPAIVQMWWDLDAAAKLAINTGTLVEVRSGVAFGMKNGNLLMRLPSGRCLVYQKAFLQKFYVAKVPEIDKTGTPKIYYDEENTPYLKFVHVKLGKVFKHTHDEFKERMLSKGVYYNYAVFNEYLKQFGLSCKAPKPTIRETVCFWGMDGIWKVIETYGPKFFENLVQAACRDLLMHSVINVEKAGISVVLTVHDEFVAEVEQDAYSLDEVKKIMLQLPGWCAMWPVRADGFIGPYYMK